MMDKSDSSKVNPTGLSHDIELTSIVFNNWYVKFNFKSLDSSVSTFSSNNYSQLFWRRFSNSNASLAPK